MSNMLSAIITMWFVLTSSTYAVAKMEDSIDELIHFIQLNSHYNYEIDVDVRLIPKSDLNTMFIEETGTDIDNVVGIYVVAEKIIFLRDDFDIDDAFDKSILLHELVHAMQDKDGIITDEDISIADIEIEAYQLQRKYLESMGEHRAADMTAIVGTFIGMLDAEEYY